MSLLSLLGITTANAATTTAPHQGNFWSMLWLPLLIIVVFYFLLIRPQSKRAKDHKALLGNITIGDEVVTTGGIVAKVVRLRDNYIVLELSKGVEITLQKSSIGQILPKGTIDSSK